MDRPRGEGAEYWAEKIGDWTEEHIGQRLEITAAKDHYMKRFYDDRCIQVTENTGMPIMEIPGVAELVTAFRVEELKDRLLHTSAPWLKAKLECRPEY